MTLRWILYFIPALVVELLAWLLTPIVCLFVVKRSYTDKVKRTYNKTTVTLEREFLPDWLSLFATHDNPVDEFWWGEYDSFLRTTTQAQYDSSWWLRYAYRCMWLFRNTAYGFHYEWFSVPNEGGIITKKGTKGFGFWYEYVRRPSSFQLEYHLPIPFTDRYISGNIGWKGHKGFDRMMYANRVIGLRRH